MLYRIDHRLTDRELEPVREFFAQSVLLDGLSDECVNCMHFFKPAGNGECEGPGTWCIHCIPTYHEVFSNVNHHHANLSFMNDGDRLKSAPAVRISGEASVPGDKSISHRLAMIGAVAEGDTTIH